MSDKEATQKLIKTWDSVSSKYDQKFSPMSIYDETYNEFSKLLPKADSQILEVGCGPGNVSNYFLTKNPRLNWFGTDFSTEMISIASNKVSNAKFEVLDARKIGNLELKFDGVIAGFLLPYLDKFETKNFLSDCKNLLTLNGKLYISVDEGDYEDSCFKLSSDGKTGMQLYYYDFTLLQEMLFESGFKILNSFDVYYQINDELSSNHVVIIAEKT